MPHKELIEERPPIARIAQQIPRRGDARNGSRTTRGAARSRTSRMRSARGAASASGTSPFASTAAPNSAAAAGRKRASRFPIHGSASSIAAENVAVNRRSGTAGLAEADPRDGGPENRRRHQGGTATELASQNPPVECEEPDADQRDGKPRREVRYPDPARNAAPVIQ